MWVVQFSGLGTVRATLEHGTSCICINLGGLEEGSMYDLVDSKGRLWFSTRADSAGRIGVFDGKWIPRIAVLMHQNPAEFLQLERSGTVVACAKIRNHESHPPRAPYRPLRRSIRGVFLGNAPTNKRSDM